LTSRTQHLLAARRRKATEIFTIATGPTNDSLPCRARSRRRGVRRAVPVVARLCLSPGVAIAEILVGAYLAGNFFKAIWRRIRTYDDVIEISGFFFGARKAVISPSDLVSVRYRPVQQAAWGLPAFDFAIFELHGQTSPNYYPIPRYGWSANRELFRAVAAMVDASPVTLDERTNKKLRAAAGL
jgi:hypothetical protein